MTTIRKIIHAAPVSSERIGTRQFLELTGLNESELQELIRMEWLLPATTAQQEHLFMKYDVLRVRKYVRLCVDFELSPVAGTIIVDLLQRIDALEGRVRELSRLL